jgi:hypothetical protein
MFDVGKLYPCWAIVKFEHVVSWPDALAAYISFYHVFLHKNRSADEAVTAMNQAAGFTDVFQRHLAGAGPQGVGA